MVRSRRSAVTGRAKKFWLVTLAVKMVVAVDAPLILIGVAVTVNGPAELSSLKTPAPIIICTGVAGVAVAFAKTSALFNDANGAEKEPFPVVSLPLVDT
jgi:hypothetical protein